MRRYLLSFLPFILLVALPLSLRPWYIDGSDEAPERLVILTPHPEAIKYEFEQAFTKYYKEKTGKRIATDWRAPGGTSDIVRFINDRFQNQFRVHWENDLNKEWTPLVAESFDNRRLKLDDPDANPLAIEARRAFLDSDVGIGADIFFGGGQYDHNKQAQMGHAVNAGIQAMHPDWFSADVIPQHYSGETFYDSQGRYYGTCLAAFGICYNRKRLTEFSGLTPPTRWDDLGAPRLFQETVIADPTKSGSITKCFEMLIQQKLDNAWQADGEAGLKDGWHDAMDLIKRIGGNARTITNAAGKVPRDVAIGDAVAGLCIDFYGRTESEWTAYQAGENPRLIYVTPTGGSSISADPIQLLRGAPNREAAVMFIEFVLSPAGQKLWNYRPGTPGGPEKHALRRLPVRRDMYTEAHRQHMSDSTVNPFDDAKDFEYHVKWTGYYFGMIRTFIRCMVIDPHDELKAAWGAIIAAGGPGEVPQAYAAFSRLPFEFDERAVAANALRSKGDDRLESMQTQREWAEFFRASYRRARELAEAGK